MSDPNTVKILIAGDVRGNLPALYKRVEAVNASPAGPFTALFCVGNFFGESPAAADGDGTGAGDDATHAGVRPYIDGTLTAPLPTYFIDGLPDGREFCRDPSGVVAPNVTFLRSAKVHEIQGLRVAALPGRHNPLVTTTNHSWRRRRRSARGSTAPQTYVPYSAATRPRKPTRGGSSTYSSPTNGRGDAIITRPPRRETPSPPHPPPAAPPSPTWRGTSSPGTTSAAPAAATTRGSLTRTPGGTPLG